MELRYVEVKNWDNLGDGDIVLFKLPKQQIKYCVTVLDNRVFCGSIKFENSHIFYYLNLDAEDFVQNIVGYPCEGGWPEVKSIDDLKKVIKALDDECIKKFEKPNTSKFKVGDKVRILPKNNNINYHPIYTETMQERGAGRIDIVKEIYKNTGSIVLKQLDYYWDPKALELIDEKEESKTMDINQAKDGDYLSITNSCGTKYIILFRSIEATMVTRYANYNLLTHDFYFNLQKDYGYWGLLKNVVKVDYATEEEKRLLDSKLLEEGYRWNNSTKKIEAIGSSNTSINIDKPETQFEAELNLFPTKKHYQLNFNY